LTTLNTLVRAGVEIHADLRSHFCGSDYQQSEIYP
jgi:hypothetical protein